MNNKRLLSDNEVQKGLRSIIFDGMMSQALTTFTGSVFLTAFALTLGASDFIVGVLATIPLLANVIQIPAALLVEKLRVRKSITVLASALSRALWLVIAAIPFIAADWAIPLIIITLIALSLLAAVGGCSWNSWINDIVPKQSLGKFFSQRMLRSTATAIPAALLAAWFISWWQQTFPGLEVMGYSLLFVAGLIFGLIGVAVIARMPEPAMVVQTMPPLAEIIKSPFADHNFCNLIKFLASWNFSINLVLPFLTVYLITTFGYSASLVTVFGVVSQLASMLFFRIWGVLCDRYSNVSVLKIAGPAMVVVSLLWATTSIFAGSTWIILLIVGIHLLSGAASAGVNLATGNIGLKLAPREKATSYLAASSLFSAVSAGLAPLIGGIAIGFVGGWEYFFILAFFLGLVSLHYLRKLKEAGNAPSTIVAKELVVELKQTTSPQKVKSTAKSWSSHLLAGLR
ncbi:MFS transporter [Candidatus Methanomassiliicoccus intestinalis]|uniref:MFS transporter n=1 Tax=Candidatus Methanomassiliicoccus intestinalis TaxID=1406512 RepID=UPI0037DD4CF5